MEQPHSESWRRVREKFSILVKSEKRNALRIGFTSLKSGVTLWEMGVGWGLINMVGVLGITLERGDQVGSTINIATAGTS